VQRPTRDELHQLTKSELIDIVEQQAQTIAKLEARVASLEAQLREKNSSKPPFSKGTRKANPKRPGRKPGQGPFLRRSAPEITPQDEVTTIDVPLPVDQRQCPDCKVPLETTNEEATTLDVPAKPMRKVTRFTVERGRCPICGKVLRGRHPQLGKHQHGISAHQLGDCVKAQSLALHYHHGVPLRKVPAIVLAMTGITLTQGAVTQWACELTQAGSVLDAVYQALREELQKSPTVNTDDTGWRTGGEASYLMGFFNSAIMFYQVRPQHRHEEVIEVLGTAFAGILGTDRGSSYNARALVTWDMQKCLSHLMRNITEVLETKVGRARSFPLQLKSLLKQGLALWWKQERQELPAAEYLRQGAVVDAQIGALLRARKMADADCQRLLDGIGLAYNQGRVTLFLKRPEIEPTNNRAERGLRPAVTARKVSQCSKNERGAVAYGVLRTIFGTLNVRGADIIASFQDLLRGQPMPQAPPC
jgi:transposase